MPRKKGGTEAYLGTFSETLNEYEQAVVHRAAAAATLENCDRHIENLRKQLLHLVGSTMKVTGLLPARTSPETEKTPGTKPKTAQEKLEKLDPRIQRSVEQTRKAIQDLGGSAHKSAVAKQLGISAQATIQRLARGVKLGLLRTSDKGVYELRSG